MFKYFQKISLIILKEKIQGYCLSYDFSKSMFQPI